MAAAAEWGLLGSAGAITPRHSPLLTEFQVPLQHGQINLEVIYVQRKNDHVCSDLGLHRVRNYIP